MQEKIALSLPLKIVTAFYIEQFDDQCNMQINQLFINRRGIFLRENREHYSDWKADKSANQ